MSDSENQNRGGSGCGCYVVGMPIAAIASWILNHSVLWAIFHGIFWAPYLLYLCMGCGGGWPAELTP